MKHSPDYFGYRHNKWAGITAFRRGTHPFAMVVGTPWRVCCLLPFLLTPYGFSDGSVFLIVS
jgi:hypothetical protein